MSITKGETRSVPSLSWVWRSAWLVMAVIALSLLAYGFVSQASSTIYSITMAFFLALAMEPAVGKLATRMPRAAATGRADVATRTRPAPDGDGLRLAVHQYDAGDHRRR